MINSMSENHKKSEN